MITPEEATHIILTQLYFPKKESIALLQSRGRVLAENLVADSDLPPFNRVMMDGIAISYVDWSVGQREFTIENTQRAGDPQLQMQTAQNCIEVMTGAVCPLGCDTVIPYEQLNISDTKCVIKEFPVERGQHIQKKGYDKKRNDILVPIGKKIDGPEIGIGASVGKSTIDVRSFPRVHVFSTGEELVEIESTPEPYQIRRSNVFALQQILQSQGIASTESHLPDQYDVIFSQVKKALETNDVLLLTGGVSKGKFDLIPEVMKHLEVEQLFHRIAQKPGKPMWFGRTASTIVFAFPGNPVSTFMCAVRYLLPWLHHSMEGVPRAPMLARLGVTYQNKTNLVFFQMIKLQLSTSGEFNAYPVASGGSGDFTSLTDADGFLEIPAGPDILEKGSVLPVYLFRPLF